MPAETHQHLDRIAADDVLAVVAAVLGVDEPPALDAPLAAFGVVDDVDVLRLWEDVAEDLAERTLAPDLEELDLVSVGDVVEAVLDALG